MAEALHAYYERDGERERLANGIGRLEFLRTTEIIRRTLPSAPAVIADIGGGPGRYTSWLVDAGYSVIHRDLVPLHIEHVHGDHGEAVDSQVGDARSLDLAAESVDAVLLLGPLYHLENETDRVQSLREATRIVKPGGRIYAAAISRWAPRLDGILIAHFHVAYPHMLAMVDEFETTGHMKPVHEGSFNGFAHRPQQLADEVLAAGLDLETLVAVEGMAFALGDLRERLADPVEEKLLLDTLRATEAVPELLGVSPHLLAVARRSA